MIAERIPEAGLTFVLDLSFSAISVLAAAGAWAATHYALPHKDLIAALPAGSVVLLACALLGNRMVQAARDASKNTAGRIYDAVFRRLIQTGGKAVKHRAAQGSDDAIAGLIGDLALLMRGLRNSRVRERLNTAASFRALQESRTQAQSVASGIRKDAGHLAAVAAAIDFTGEHTAREVAGAAQCLLVTEAGMDRAASKLDALARSVRTITANAEQMTSVAVDLSRITHAARQSVTESDGQTASLRSAMDSIEQALQAAAARGRSIDVGTALSVVDGENVAATASTLQHIAEDCRPALDTVDVVIKHLIAEAAEANRRTLEISNLVLNSRDVGEAIGHAVHQQGADIAEALSEIYQAREGCATLQTAVESVVRAGAPQQNSTQSLRLIASNLPDRAESIASLLRGIADFAPPSEYQP